jgi:hypothetical protein
MNEPIRLTVFVRLQPNASLQLLPEARAQRTLEAVSCKALFGKRTPIRHKEMQPLVAQDRSQSLAALASAAGVFSAGMTFTDIQ